MERRAASHTEEEEMNQRRKLLNAAKKGDQKAIGKLFELYQVRIFSGEQVQKMNRAAGLHKLQHNKPGSTGRGAKAAPASKHAAGKTPSQKPVQKVSAKLKKQASPPRKKK